MNALPMYAQDRDRTGELFGIIQTQSLPDGEDLLTFWCRASDVRIEDQVWPYFPKDTSMVFLDMVARALGEAHRLGRRGAFREVRQQFSDLKDHIADGAE